MDIPNVPVHETPVVLAQSANTGSVVQKPDYILNLCQETEHTTDPRSAFRGVDPAGWLAVELGNRNNRDILNNPSVMAAIKVTLLEGTKHGQLTAGVSNYGRVAYRYDPEAGYLGDDKAVFMAEFEGKRYKIVVEIKVLEIVDYNSPQCGAPQLIKVNGKPASGSLGTDLNAVPVTFSDLAGGAVGQAVGSTITLDTTAAGHNWFIDTTPWDNSEYLPTSNPYEWVAKEGTAAYGKMDMLSVLLHEYGHALGIDHSADNHD
jgi:hypothetical protein